MWKVNCTSVAARTLACGKFIADVMFLCCMMAYEGFCATLLRWERIGSATPPIKQSCFLGLELMKDQNYLLVPGT